MTYEPYTTDVLKPLYEADGTVAMVKSNKHNYREAVAQWLDANGYTLEFPVEGVALFRCLAETSKAAYDYGIAGQYGVVVVKAGVVRVIQMTNLQSHVDSGWVVIKIS